MTSYVVERFIHWQQIGSPEDSLFGRRPGESLPPFVSAGLPAHAVVYLKPRAEPRLMRIEIAGGGKGRLVEETDAPGHPWRPAVGDVVVHTRGPVGRGEYFAVWTLGATLETTRDYVARLAWGRLNANDMEFGWAVRALRFDTTVTMNDFGHRWLICHYLESWIRH